MYFPFWYTGDLVFYKPDNFNSKELLRQFEPGATSSEIIDETIVFSSAISILKGPVKVKLSLSDENTTIQCIYHISLFENNIVLIFSLVFLFFLIHFDAFLIAFFILGAGIIYYPVNTLKISKSIKKTIFKYIGHNYDIGKPELWKKQQKWLNDNSVCPACGETINPYSSKCVNCGLFLHKKSQKYSNINSSNTKYKNILYDISKKKK